MSIEELDFVAGGAFGIALLFATFVLVIAVLFPMGHTDWASFAKGAIVVPLLAVLIIALIAGTAWLLSRPGGIG